MLLRLPTLALLAALPATLIDPAAVEQLMDRQLAQKAQIIEIVSVAGRLSHLEYRHDSGPAIRPAPLPTLRYGKPELIPYGSLVKDGKGFRRRDSGPGGVIVDLAGTGSVQSLLPYRSISLSGLISGRWQLALADHAHLLRDDNVALAHLAPLGSGSTREFPLQKLAGRLDLARSRYLVFRLEGEQGRLELQEVAFSRLPAAPRPTLRGTWLWDRRLVIGGEEKVVADLAAHGINRLYLQVDDEPARLIPFLRLAARRKIEVYALDGSPDAVLESAPLLARLRLVREHNRRHPDAAFAGVQLDVEPYLRKDFQLRRDQYLNGYLQLLENAAAICGRELPLSVAVPFWFAHLRCEESDFIGRLFGSADEIVVMSYRTNAEEIGEITGDFLAYGESSGKPVLLGLELSPLPDEMHQVLHKGSAAGASAIVLGGLSWRAGALYQVPGSRLSFAGQYQKLPAVLAQTPPFASFQGWVLHSYEALRDIR
ncbi:MAG: hypothetical protein A2075_06980 [Geobacteraceae bacterium GWC2_58_44]|nr:MAG: hypothetical protein A2075_06980 [Geobacteraceae bacterium GWC2_58_44]HBG04633.1 hypothetical protein [Geobacter sp.]